jgi:hypothetical protein
MGDSMHKVHKKYKYEEQRGDRVFFWRGFEACRRRSLQQLKYREEEWCIEWIWHIEHKSQRHIKRKDGCSKTVRQ